MAIKKNTVDYFPHPVNHGRKMFYLRNEFKNDGYAVWFMLLEHLGKANYHYLNLSDDIELMYLASEFKVDEKIIIKIIEALVKFEEFDKELWNEERILFNEKFVERIQQVYKKRSNKCIDKNTLLHLLDSKGILNKLKCNPNSEILPLTEHVETRTKLKKSKLEYSKEDFSDISRYDLFKNWINYRVEIKKPIKVEQTFKRLMKTFNDKPFDELNFVVNASIDNQWQGLIWERFKGAKSNLNNKKEFK